MRAYLFALVASGCGFSSGAIGASPDAGADDPPPGDLPPGDARICGGVFDQVCVEPPSSPLMLTTRTIDTSRMTAPSPCVAYSAIPAVDACVIAGSSITIPGNHTVTVIGDRPLILFATGSITISGVLDGSSHRQGTTGPGADTGPCSTHIMIPSAGSVGDGGGGFGGSFGAPGNNGGNGGLAGQGGVAAPAFNTTTLRGGCLGGEGAGGKAGAAGHGGGAVLLIAAQTLTIDGTVNASGSGGSGGSASSGGGGGGSGGMIVLDAASVNTPGKCFANGGGGGEGGNAFVDGNAGDEASAPNATGTGGSGTFLGGNGGAGGSGTTSSGAPGFNGELVPLTNVGGGGGGGAGAGIIKIFAPEQDNTADPSKVAPPPSP
jgi:hypothetical protein